MKIPLNEIFTPGLLRLMRDVAAELEARHNAPAVQHVQATRPVETVTVSRLRGRAGREVVGNVAGAGQIH